MSPGGRPEIGQPINIRLGDHLLAQVDKKAADAGTSRASMIRSLIIAAMSELDDDTIWSY